MASRQQIIAQGTVWIYFATEELAGSAAQELTQYQTGGQPFATDIEHRPGEWRDKAWRLRGHAVLPSQNVGKLQDDMRRLFPPESDGEFRGYEPTPAGRQFPPSEPYAND